MRTLWKLFLVLPLLISPAFIGCSGQISQEAGDEYEEVHPEDGDDAGDTEVEESEE
jgi:hypothetical protein